MPFSIHYCNKIISWVNYCHNFLSWVWILLRYQWCLMIPSSNFFYRMFAVYFIWWITANFPQIFTVSMEDERSWSTSTSSTFVVYKLTNIWHAIYNPLHSFFTTSRSKLYLTFLENICCIELITFLCSLLVVCSFLQHATVLTASMLECQQAPVHPHI